MHEFDTPFLMYTTDTALDHMARMDEHESPVDAYVTKNCYCNVEGFAGRRHREWNWWCTEWQEARSRTIDEEVPYGFI